MIYIHDIRTRTTHYGPRFRQRTVVHARVSTKPYDHKCQRWRKFTLTAWQAFLKRSDVLHRVGGCYIKL